MDYKAIKTVRNGFNAFMPIICFNTHESAETVIQQAINDDPTIAYYLHYYSVSCVAGRYEIKAQFIHKNTAKKDIQIAYSQQECEELICRYVGNYKKELLMVVKRGIGYSAALESFLEKHASFYPNLISCECSEYHIYQFYSVFHFTFDYRIGRVKLTLMEQEVEAEVKRISKLLFLPGTPNPVKIYLAHNYLTTNVKYIDSKSNNLDLSYTQSAYGALINKHCVCQGYAEAFKRLMDNCGIDCFVIYGHTDDSDVLHAWNMVSLGQSSNYYHIDVTWDSMNKRTVYTYFCKNDSFFKGKRSWNTDYLPKCDGSYPVLSIARNYLANNKKRFIDNGVDKAILDC